MTSEPDIRAWLMVLYETFGKTSQFGGLWGGGGHCKSDIIKKYLAEAHCTHEVYQCNITGFFV